MTGPALEEQVAALARPAAYPDDPSAAGGVEWVQTHISHVFLTGERVYKVRKPVDLGFVCFATRAERNADCEREVALNRRLAPDVYLGVAALRPAAGGLVVGPVREALDEGTDGEPPEHCVVMRRLPGGRDALSLLQQGRLAPEQLDRLAARVARFHAEHGLGVPAPFSRSAWRERCTRPVEESFASLDEAVEHLSQDEIDLARSRCRSFASEHADRFESRRLAGRAVDAHGDLHLQHVWFETEDASPLVIDCLEFNEALRCIDAAAEVAFPSMDLDYRGRPDLAERFLAVYAAESDDFDLYAVVDYFAGYRAAVRAKVAALASIDPAIEPQQRGRAAESARRHLALAARALEPRRPGSLVLVGGVVGTGKSTVARELRDRVGGVVVASDAVRKRGIGLAPREPGERQAAAPDAGLYAPEARERVYAGLLERARPVLASGRTAILDATWSRRAHREAAVALACDLDASVCMVETRCPPALARDRLARRQAEGTDPSDAGPEFHAISAARFEARSESEELRWHVVATDRPGWREELAVLLADSCR